MESRQRRPTLRGYPLLKPNENRLFRVRPRMAAFASGRGAKRARTGGLLYGDQE